MFPLRKVLLVQCWDVFPLMTLIQAVCLSFQQSHLWYFLFVCLFAFNHDYQRSHDDTEFTPVDVGAHVGQRRRSRARVIRADRCLCLWPSCHVCSDVDQPDLLLHYVCLSCSNKPPTWDEEQLLWPGGGGRIRSAVTFFKKLKRPLVFTPLSSKYWFSLKIQSCRFESDQLLILSWSHKNMSVLGSNQHLLDSSWEHLKQRFSTSGSRPKNVLIGA